MEYFDAVKIFQFYIFPQENLMKLHTIALKCTISLEQNFLTEISCTKKKNQEYLTLIVWVKKGYLIY